MPPEKRPLDNFLRVLTASNNLEAEDRNAIVDLPIRLRSLDAGSYLIREGGVPTHCAILVDGFAYRHKTTGHGGRQILAVCIPGDAVDLQNIFLDASDHSAQMLTRGVVADISREVLQDMVLTRPAVGRAIIQLTLVESSILREWVVNIGRRDARERIAHILCEFAVRLETRGLASSKGFELPMTQEQLADATGLTAVHVNRVLKSLEADGLIERRRRVIHFVDWRAIQETADFSRAYLHVPSEDVL